MSLYSKATKAFNKWSENSKQYMISTIIVIAVVLFILGVIRPFGIEALRLSDYLGVLFYSLIGTFLGALFIYYIAGNFFSSFYSREHQTIGKIVIRNLISALCCGVMVGLSGVVYTTLRFGVPVSQLGSQFIFHIFAVLVIYPIPTIISDIWIRNRALTRHLQEAQELNIQLINKGRSNVANEDNNIVTLQGSTKESVDVPLDNLLYLEAYGNYIKVFFRENAQIKQKMIRATIKQMEDELINHSSLIRFHRAFIVNTNNIGSVKGNSQGYKLTFNNYLEEIPVSRSYTKAIQDQIEQI